MLDLKRSIRSHSVECAVLLCMFLVVILTTRCTSDSITGAEDPAPADADPMGTIHGSVTSGGSPLSGVEIWITSQQMSRLSAITDAEGGFTFIVPPGGPYIVRLATAASPANVCESVTVMVEAGESVTVQMPCQPLGILSGAVQWTNGSVISNLDVQVSLRGPVSREGQITNGRFGFSQLPAGEYTVTPGIRCSPVTVTVGLGEVTRVDISCQVPTFAEIQGEWTISMLPWDYWEDGPQQTGGCPPPLAFQASGSVAFDAATNRVSIIGLTPDLTIPAQLDPAICEGTDCTRAFHGTGTAVRPDGSFIRTMLNGSFHFSILDGTYSLLFGLEREHRLASDELVCSESYSLEGTNPRG